MSVAITGAYSFTTSSATTAHNPQVQSITVPANTNMALVCIYTFDGTSGTIVPNGVQIGGIDCIWVASAETNTFYSQVFFAYLPNPPIGSTTLVFTCDQSLLHTVANGDGSTGYQYVMNGILFLSGVNTGAPFGAQPVSQNSVSTVAETLVVGATGTSSDLFVGFYGAGTSSSSVTSATNQFDVHSPISNALELRCDTLAGNTGSAQFAWTGTVGGAANSSCCAMLIKAAPSNMIAGMSLGMDYRWNGVPTANGDIPMFLTSNSMAALLPNVGIQILDSTGFDLSNATSVTNPNTTYTVPTGADMLVFTWTTAFGSGAANPTAVTYNGVALTHIPQAQNISTNFGTDIWFLANPATGASHTIAITCAAQKFVACGVLSLKGTAPLLPVMQPVTTGGATNSPTLTATGGIAGDLYVACAQIFATGITDGGSQNQRWTVQPIQSTDAADCATLPGNVSGAFSWSPGGSQGGPFNSASALCINQASKVPVVQVQFNPNPVANNVTTNSITFTNNVTVGNRIVVMWVAVSSTNDITMGSASDNLGNTYSSIDSSNNGSGSNPIYISIWSATVTTGGSCTVTVGWSGTSSALFGEMSMCAWELTGITGIDQHSNAYANSTTVTATCPSANAFSDDIVLAMYQQCLSNSTTITHPPTSTGYWWDVFYDSDSGRNSFQRDFAMHLCTTAETSSVTYTPPVSGFVGTALVSFKRH